MTDELIRARREEIAAQQAVVDGLIAEKYRTEQLERAKAEGNDEAAAAAEAAIEERARLDALIEERKKYADEYSNTLQHIARLREADAISEEDAIARKLAAIDKYQEQLTGMGYDSLGDTIGDRTLKALAELESELRDVADATDDVSESTSTATMYMQFATGQINAMTQAVREYKDETDDALDEATQKWLRHGAMISGSAANIWGSIATIVGNSYQAQIDAAEGNAEKQKQLQIEQAKAQKRMAIFGAVLSTAQAVMNALSTVKPFLPTAVIAASLAAAEGAAQVAAIASQPIPKMARGGDFTVPPGYPGDSFPMMVESGERVQVTPRNRNGGGGGDIYLDGERVGRWMERGVREGRIILN